MRSLRSSVSSLKLARLQHPRAPPSHLLAAHALTAPAPGRERAHRANAADVRLGLPQARPLPPGQPQARAGPAPRPPRPALPPVSPPPLPRHRSPSPEPAPQKPCRPHPLSHLDLASFPSLTQSSLILPHVRRPRRPSWAAPPPARRRIGARAELCCAARPTLRCLPLRAPWPPRAAAGAPPAIPCPSRPPCPALLQSHARTLQPSPLPPLCRAGSVAATSAAPRCRGRRRCPNCAAPPRRRRRQTPCPARSAPPAACARGRSAWAPRRHSGPTARRAASRRCPPTRSGGRPRCRPPCQPGCPTATGRQ